MPGSTISNIVYANNEPVYKNDPDYQGLLAALPLSITNNVIPKGTGTSITDSDWEFNGSTLMPTTTGEIQSKGVDATASNYAFRSFDSVGAYKFAVRNDGFTSVGSAFQQDGELFYVAGDILTTGRFKARGSAASDGFMLTNGTGNETWSVLQNSGSDAAMVWKDGAGGIQNLISGKTTSGTYFNSGAGISVGAAVVAATAKDTSLYVAEISGVTNIVKLNQGSFDCLTIRESGNYNIIRGESSFGIKFGVDGQDDLVTLDFNTQNVGINRTSPTATLHLGSIGTEATYAQVIDPLAADVFNITRNNAQNMFKISNSEIQIGVVSATTSNEILKIKGNTRIESAGAYHYFISDGDGRSLRVHENNNSSTAYTGKAIGLEPEEGGNTINTIKSYVTVNNGMPGTLRITSTNLGLNTDQFGTSADGILSMGLVTTDPTSSPADIGQMWVDDHNGAGTATWYFRNEEGDEFFLAKAAALTAVDSTVIDATYGSDEEGVLNNVRTRLGEVESLLQNIGLLT